MCTMLASRVVYVHHASLSGVLILSFQHPGCVNTLLSASPGVIVLSFSLPGVIVLSFSLPGVINPSGIPGD